MSVVALVTHDDFTLIMGDTKLSNDSHTDKISKVFKKENMLLGFTGNIIEVGTYLYPIFDEHMQINNDYIWEDPIHFFFTLDCKFYLNIDAGIEKDIIFVASAKIGDKYITKYYCLKNSNGYRWRTETLISDENIRYYYLGDQLHKNYFIEQLKQKPIVSKNNFIDIFQSAIEYGKQYDDTINNEMEYEYI